METMDPPAWEETQTLGVGVGADVEITTTIRGREVRCRLVGGVLDGDAELLARLQRHGNLDDLQDPIRLIRRVHDAVGSPVSVRVVDRN